MRATLLEECGTSPDRWCEPGLHCCGEYTSGVCLPSCGSGSELKEPNTVAAALVVGGTLLALGAFFYWLKEIA